MREVRSILRVIRKTAYHAEDPFGIVGSEAVQGLWRSLTAGAFALMILISGISLVGSLIVAHEIRIAVVASQFEVPVVRCQRPTRRSQRRTTRGRPFAPAAGADTRAA